MSQVQCIIYHRDNIITQIAARHHIDRTIPPTIERSSTMRLLTYINQIYRPVTTSKPTRPTYHIRPVRSEILQFKAILIEIFLLIDINKIFSINIDFPSFLSLGSIRLIVIKLCKEKLAFSSGHTTAVVAF